MSKTLIAQSIQETTGITGVLSKKVTNKLLDDMAVELKKNGRLAIPGFGTFTVRKIKARKGINPKTGEPIKVKASRTVRFKSSPKLKKKV